MRKLLCAGAVVSSLLAIGSISRATLINFDDLPSNILIPNNYYTGVTFSYATGLSPMAAGYVGPSPFSSANVLAAYDGVRGPTSVFDMYADFSPAVNNLKFLAVAADEFGVVARVNVYSGATLLGTDNIIGNGPSPGNFGNAALASTPVNLSAYSNVTRIEVVPPIGQPVVDDSYGGGGLVYDNFSFESVPEPGSIALFALAGLALTRRKARRAIVKRAIVASAITLSVAQFSGSANAGLISGIGGAPSWPNWVGPNTIDFDTQTPGNFTSTLIGNTKFTGVDGDMRISSAYINQYNTYGVQSLQSGVETNPITPHTIQFDFTTPVSAVAWDWGAADNAWVMSAYDSSNALIESHIITLPFSGTDLGEYFGIDAPDIKRVVLVDQLDNYPDGDFVFIDDFTTSFETAPEPTLLAPIVLFAALLRRRAGRN